MRLHTLRQGLSNEPNENTKISITFYRAPEFDGHPLNPQQPNDEPLPFVVKFIIFCFEEPWTFSPDSWNYTRHSPSNFSPLNQVAASQIQFDRYDSHRVQMSVSNQPSIIASLLSLTRWDWAREHAMVWAKWSSRCHFDKWSGHVTGWSYKIRTRLNVQLWQGNTQIIIIILYFGTSQAGVKWNHHLGIKRFYLHSEIFSFTVYALL